MDPECQAGKNAKSAVAKDIEAVRKDIEAVEANIEAVRKGIKAGKGKKKKKLETKEEKLRAKEKALRDKEKALRAKQNEFKRKRRVAKQVRMLDVARSMVAEYEANPDTLFSDFERFSDATKAEWLLRLIQSWDRLSEEQRETHKHLGPEYVLHQLLRLKQDKKSQKSTLRKVAEKNPGLLFDNWKPLMTKFKAKESLTIIRESCWDKLTHELKWKYYQLLSSIYVARHMVFESEYQGSGMTLLNNQEIEDCSLQH